MTGAELISTTIGFYDNTLAADAENANRRLRILHYAKMVLAEIWNWRSWSFKHSTGTVTMSGGEGLLPSDFARFGTEGLVYQTPNRFWTEAALQDVRAMQAAGNRTERVFAVSAESGQAVSAFYQGTATAASGATILTFTTAVPATVHAGDVISCTAGNLVVMGTSGVIVVVRDPIGEEMGFSGELVTFFRGSMSPILVIPESTSMVLTVFYERVPAALYDDATPVDLPVSYHETVLLAGVLARTQTAKNDTRIYWEKQYAMGLGRMVVNEMPLASRLKQLPRSIAGRSG